MDLPSTLSIYSSLLQDPLLLQDGKAFLEKFLNEHPSFILYSFQIFLFSEQNLQYRTFVGIFIKNLIKDNWEENKNLIDNRTAIINLLLTGLEKNLLCPKILEILGLIISDLITKESPSHWKDPLLVIASLMDAGSSIDIMNAALDFLTIVFEKTDNRICFIVGDLNPKLLNLALNKDVLVVFYHSLSSISFADSSDKALIAQSLEKTIVNWLKLCIETLQIEHKIKPSSNNSAENSDQLLTHQRIILKILTVFFRDFPIFSKGYAKESIGVVFKFFADFIPSFWADCVFESSAKLSSTVNLIDEENDFENETEGVLVQAVELIATMINKKEVKQLVKPAFYPLIYALSNCLLVEKYQESQFLSDPNQYISDEEDEGNMISVRNVILTLIIQMIDQNYDLTLRILNAIVEDNLTGKRNENYFQTFTQEAAKDKNFAEASKYINFEHFFNSTSISSSHTSFLPKRREVGFLLLGNFSEEILDYQKKTSSVSLTLLISNLLSQIKSESDLSVRIRILWALSRFGMFLEEEEKEAGEEGVKLADLIMKEEICLAGKFIAAKTCSMYSIIFKYNSAVNRFLHKLWSMNLHNDVAKCMQLEKTIEEIFKLINIANEETIHILIDFIIILSKVFPSSRLALAQLGSSYFLKLFELFHNEALIGPMFLELLEALIIDYQAYEVLAEIFSGVIIRSFEIFYNHLAKKAGTLGIKPTDISYFTNVLLLLEKFLAVPNQGCKSEFYVLLTPLLNIVLLTDDLSIISHAYFCLNVFVKNFEEKIKENNLSPLFMKIVEKITQEQADENLLLQSGIFIILVIEKLFKMNVNIQLYKNLLVKMQSIKSPSILQNVFLVFSYFINSENSSYFIQFLVENNSLSFFVERITTYLEVIHGDSLRNSIFATLITIYKPNLGLDEKSLFSIFQTLVKELISRNKKPNLPAITKLVGKKEEDDEEEEDDGFEDIDEFEEGAEGEEERRRKEYLKFLGDKTIAWDVETALKDLIKNEKNFILKLDGGVLNSLKKTFPNGF